MKTNSLHSYMPLLGMPVFITTNWAKYVATLKLDEFGFARFDVDGAPKVVQLTVVTSWDFLEEIGSGNSETI